MRTVPKDKNGNQLKSQRVYPCYHGYVIGLDEGFLHIELKGKWLEDFQNGERCVFAMEIPPNSGIAVGDYVEVAMAVFGVTEQK